MSKIPLQKNVNLSQIKNAEVSPKFYLALPY